MDVIAAIMWLLLVGITIFAIISLKGGSGGTTNPSQLSPYVELVYHDLQKQLNSAGYSLRDIRELEINSLNIEITTDGVNSHGSRCYKSFFVTKFADLGFTISSWDSEYKEYLSSLFGIQEEPLLRVPSLVEREPGNGKQASHTSRH